MDRTEIPLLSRADHGSFPCPLRRRATRPLCRRSAETRAGLLLAGILIFGAASFSSDLPVPIHLASAAGQETRSRMILDVNPEDRDVGLKRMEILDRSLTPELIRKKNAFVRMKEEDYDRKIGELVQRLTTPIGRNTVVTHIDVNFFDPGFEQQVQAEEKVSVTILLDSDGFAKWAAGKGSEEAARNLMQDLVSRTFNIPRDQISIVIAPN